MQNAIFGELKAYTMKLAGNPLERKRGDKAREIITCVALAACFIPLLLKGRLEPGALIPIHYDIYGVADKYGSADSFRELPAVAAVFYLLFTLVEKYYKKFNYPVKITEKNALYIYRASVQLLRNLKLLFIGMFAFLNNLSFAFALGGKFSSTGYVMSCFIGAVLVLIVRYYIQVVQYEA